MSLFQVFNTSKTPVMTKIAVGLKFGNLVGLRLANEGIVLLSQFRHQGYRLGKVYGVRGEKMINASTTELQDDAGEGEIVSKKMSILDPPKKKVTVKGIPYPEGIHVTLVDDLPRQAEIALASLREVRNGVCTMRTPYPVITTGIVAEGDDSKGHGLVVRYMYVPDAAEIREFVRNGKFSTRSKSVV